MLILVRVFQRKRTIRRLTPQFNNQAARRGIFPSSTLLFNSGPQQTESCSPTLERGLHPDQPTN